MKSIKRTLFWYDFRTWLVIGLLWPTGVTVIGGLLLFAWYVKRQAKRMFLEASLGQENVLTETKKLDVIMANFNHQIATINVSGEHLCLTCQTPFNTYNLPCSGLGPDVYPHYPNTKPPNPNPYEWFWFKFNGYAPPPENWPLNRSYVHPSREDPETMREEGKKYYSTHRNDAWDMGCGEIPDWYVSKVLTGYNEK